MEKEHYPVRISRPAWFTNAGGVGCVISGRSGAMRLRLQCIGAGILKFYLRSAYYDWEDGYREPYWVTYTSFVLDGTEMLARAVDAWHDEPFTFQREVEDKEEIEVRLNWHPCIKVSS